MSPERGGSLTTRGQAAAGGGAVVYTSAGRFGGDGAPIISYYLARRDDDGWSTEGLSPRQEPQLEVAGNISFYPWFSSDLSFGVVRTAAALNPGDPDIVGNLYRRDNNTGAFSTVSSTEIPTLKSFYFAFRGASATGGNVLFKLVPEGGQTPAEDQLYERTSSGEVREVIILPNGSSVKGDLGPWVNGQSFSPGFNPVSRDGSRIYFSTADTESLYLRQNGVSTTLVSASEEDPEIPRKAYFLGASVDGSVAFFRSDERLTDDSNAGQDCGFGDAETTTSDGCSNLYRWAADAPIGERLTDLTTADSAGSHLLGITAMSDDGGTVYFVATGDLTGDGAHARANLYVWHQGSGGSGIRLIARDVPDPGLWSTSISSAGGTYRQARVTPDGRYLAFASSKALTGYDSNGHSTIYLYDREAERLVCVSCSKFIAKAKNSSWFRSCHGEAEGNCGTAQEYLSRNLSEDGRKLFFDSKEALVPEDTNGVTDLYQWSGGSLHLLSSGTSAFPSRLIDASADGDDVYFTTVQRLVPSDKDTLRDLYDARVGGTPEPDIPLPCVADECQGTPLPPPAFRTPSSSSFQGSGNARSQRPRCAKKKVRRKGRCVKRKAGPAEGRKKRDNRKRRAGR